MAKITIYRWTRGDRYADEGGAFGDWVLREVLFCSKAWMRNKTESDSELGFWSAFGKTPSVERLPGGIVTFTAEDDDGHGNSSQRIVEVFEPVTFEVEGELAGTCEEVLADTRCLEWKPAGDDRDLVLLDTEKTRICIAVGADGSAKTYVGGESHA